MSKTTQEIDRRVEAFQRLCAKNPAGYRQFQDRLVMSWIYHDNGLEGVVLTAPELEVALSDKSIAGDLALMPVYQDIRNHRIAIEHTRALVEELKTKRGAKITLNTVRELHEILLKNPKMEAEAGKLRRSDIPHKVYFHEISPPDKIAVKLKIWADSLYEDENLKQHPIKAAARSHQRFMAIFPYVSAAGIVGRLIMNLMLMRDGYPPAIIHATDRQSYYESLRQGPLATRDMLIDALSTTLENGERFLTSLDEPAKPKPKKPAKPEAKSKRASGRSSARA